MSNKILNQICIILIMLIITLSIVLFYKINKRISIKKESFINHIKICCLYSYYEKNELYKSNFLYFLDNGILDDVDYYIIINGICTIDIPIKNNIIIFQRENKGYDFGAYSYALKYIKEYDYYFFINTSVKGPYLKNNQKKWTEYFLELFNDDVKVVGTSINIFDLNKFGNYNLSKIYHKNKPFTHIQSMFFCIDKEYLNYLNKINFFNEYELNNIQNINYIIVYKELGLSQYALNNNWNINSILDKYKNFDYRTIDNDFNNTSNYGDPYYKNAYFGETIDKYDVIFFKNNRSL